ATQVFRVPRSAIELRGPQPSGWQTGCQARSCERKLLQRAAESGVRKIVLTGIFDGCLPNECQKLLERPRKPAKLTFRNAVLIPKGGIEQPRGNPPDQQ